MTGQASMETLARLDAAGPWMSLCAHQIPPHPKNQTAGAQGHQPTALSLEPAGRPGAGERGVGGSGALGAGVGPEQAAPALPVCPRADRAAPVTHRTLPGTGDAKHHVSALRSGRGAL